MPVRAVRHSEPRPLAAIHGCAFLPNRLPERGRSDQPGLGTLGAMPYSVRRRTSRPTFLPALTASSWRAVVGMALRRPASWDGDRSHSTGLRRLARPIGRCAACQQGWWRVYGGGPWALAPMRHAAGSTVDRPHLPPVCVRATDRRLCEPGATIVRGGFTLRPTSGCDRDGTCIQPAWLLGEPRDRATHGTRRQSASPVRRAMQSSLLGQRSLIVATGWPMPVGPTMLLGVRVIW